MGGYGKLGRLSEISKPLPKAKNTEVTGMEKIVIIGGGGHARSVLDSILSREEYEVVGYTDTHISNIPLNYLGTDDVLEELFQHNITFAAFGIGYLGKNYLRDTIFKRLKEIGFKFPAIIDRSAEIAQDAVIGEGAFVGKKAVINAGSKIGCMCIINTQATIEHTNTIGDYTHISVGATLCGDVTVGDHCLVGANATVIQGIKIGQKAIIGAGTTVLRDVLPRNVVVGTLPRMLDRSEYC